jgi:LacI family transcriptional regulator
MATLYDVCEKTGYSTATVSRVINGSERVTEKTRERVLQAIKELNYHPSHAARMLAGRKSDTIGVVLPVLDDGYCVQVLRGIDQVAMQEHLKMIIATYHNEVDLEETLGSLCGEGRANAVILLNNTSLPPDKVRKLAGDNTPIVLLGQEDETTVHADIDSVLIDNFQGACSAVEHLLEHKPKSLLLLTGPKYNQDSRERLQGARQAIRAAACKTEVTILTGDYHHESARHIFAEHIGKQGTFPDAVFAFNDSMALGILDVLNDRSRQVPEDIAIVGFDNKEIAEYIGLSTVSVPMQQIGEEAVRLLVERIRDQGRPPVSVTLDTHLVVRKTSAGRKLQETASGAAQYAGARALANSAA